MALNSSTVAAAAAATAAQYNNVRKDVVEYAGDYASSTGSANAFLLSVDAQIVTAYVEHSVFKFKANFENTAAATLNVNSLGAKTIKKNGSSDLDPGDIKSGQVVTVIYDGTNMQMLSPVSNPPFVTGTAGETIDGSTTPQAVYIKASDGKFYKTDADFVDERSDFIGLTRSNVAADAAMSVLEKGQITIPSQTLTEAVSSTIDQTQTVGTGDDSNVQNDSNDRFAQLFRVGDQVGNIEQIVVYTRNVSGTPTARTDIYAVDESTGKPTGAAVGTGTATTVVNNGDTTFTFSSPVTVTPGGVYCFVIVPVTLGGGTYYIPTDSGRYRVATRAGSGSFGTSSWISADGGSTWSTAVSGTSGGSANFDIYYTSKTYQIGDPVFLSGTAGAFTFVRPSSAIVKIGRLLSATKMLLEPRLRRFLGSSSLVSSGTNNGFCYVPPKTEEVIITAATGSGYPDGDVVLTRNKTTSTVSQRDDATTNVITFSWSGSKITVTSSAPGSASCTAYFYS